MKLYVRSVILLAAAMLAGGCVDDDLQIEPGIDAPGDNGDGSLLQLAVESYDVSVQSGSKASEPSNVPEPESEDEKRIQDFWMFQFDQAGNQLVAPKYYEIVEGDETKGTLKELTKTAYNDLTKDTPMTIYIVTNTHNSTWATGTGFDTLEGVKSQKLPSPVLPIRAGRDDEKVLIPMSGQIDNITVTDKTLVVVPVIRMYAKVKINVEFNVQNMEMYYALVSGIPSYCRVTTDDKGVDGNGEPQAVPLPDNTTMLSRAFQSTETISDSNGKWMVIYVPENIRGEVTGADKTKVPAVNVPENALAVDIRAKYDGMDYIFTVYPGENNTNNFNVRRNCVYRVYANVIGATDQHNPSSNCFIVKPGDKLQFEPYNRVEVGGGFKIEDYINPDEDAKKIEKVEIVWQTKDCIGNNSNGDLVDLGPDTGDKHRKIIVHTKKEGNALVAARNKAGDIIWSWHIWVTDNEPDNLANAIVYTTYEWDSGKATGGKYPNSESIHSDKRVPGYSVMPCNLGALAFTGKSVEPVRRGEQFCDSEVSTFGMLYQWGRKDPFPPVICYTEGTAYTTSTGSMWNPTITYYMGFLDYTEQYAGYHYKNDNTSVAKKTHLFKDVNNSEFVFHSVYSTTGNVGSTVDDGIRYGIAHPTVYLAATDREVDEDNQGNSSYGKQTYNNGGDWLPAGHDDRLWGGLPPSEAKKALELEYVSEQLGPFNAVLYDNYGTEKSVFDPCPMGWRVAPSDLWLGFTKYGIDPSNPSSNDTDMTEVNWDKESSGLYGMTMYLQGWRSGSKSYFPLQGTRSKLGRGFSTGYCGNYSNATCGDDSKVNMLHLHQNSLRFHIFEFILERYSVRSVASPVRCVRDRK